MTEHPHTVDVAVTPLRWPVAARDDARAHQHRSSVAAQPAAAHDRDVACRQPGAHTRIVVKCDRLARRRPLGAHRVSRLRSAGRSRGGRRRTALGRRRRGGRCSRQCSRYRGGSRRCRARAERGYIAFPRLVHGQTRNDRRAAGLRLAVLRYVEGFYNPHRWHRDQGSHSGGWVCAGTPASASGLRISSSRSLLRSPLDRTMSCTVRPVAAASCATAVA